MPLIQGFMLGAGICACIGPQSLFVLRRGIQRDAAMSVALICTLVDLLLIVVAVVACDALGQALPHAASIGAWCSAALILVYAAFALSAAISSERSVDLTAPGARSGIWTITAALALSLLNPQAYLELIVLVGSAAMQFPPQERAIFGIGVALVSPLWFFGLALGGSRLAGLFAQPGSLRVLDFGSGLVLLTLAAVIVNDQLG